jgi:TRAP-type C4-dicarboxylate transport system permease small subunit
MVDNSLRAGNKSTERPVEQRKPVLKVTAFERVVRRINNVLSIIGAVMLFALMVLGFSDVIGRYALNWPIPGAVEYGRILMAGMIFFFWAYAQSTRGHTTVDVLVSHYSPRAQLITNYATLLLSLVLFGLIVWQSIAIAIEDQQLHRVFAITNISLTFPRLLVTIGSIVICLEFILQIIHLRDEMRGKMRD